MKIDKTEHSDLVKGIKENTKNSSSRVDNQKESFESILNKTTSSEKVSASTSTQNTTPIDFVSNSVQIKAFREDSYNKTEKLLNTLEIYRNSLSNNKVGLSQMDDVVKEMVSLQEKTVSTLKNLPKNDELREIITLLSITVLDASQQHHNRFN